tara:strand:+ start:31 stop:6060 length:6030 start_codon:yes stop_codon:yes gene_type:complete
MSQKESTNLFLELGQMLKFIAPSNSAINDKNYYIEYLDDNIVKLINDTDLDEEIELGITNGSLNDESIEQIIILATPDVKGYARQHDLVPDTWITIEFGGDVPTIINGQITDLDEDEIELSLYNSDQKIYINFNYKGIPLELPIIDIRSFDPPELVQKEEEEESPIDIIDEDDEEDGDLELIIDSEDIKQNVQDLFVGIEDIELGEDDLGEITEMVKVKEDERRFGIETQTDDILNELIAEYPTNKRTRKVLNNIHTLIERFKQLRRKFSKFDETGNAESVLKKGADYKPIIQYLQKFNKKLKWLIPVGRNTHKLFDLETAPDETYVDAQVMEYRFAQTNVIEAQGHYKSNTVPDSQNKYIYLVQNIDPYFTPFIETPNTENIISKQKVQDNMDVLINNLENFESHMVENDTISPQQYVIDRYNLGLSRLNNPDIKNKNSKAVIVPLTNNNSIDLLGFMRLQEPYIKYSHIDLPKTSIYDKVNLHFFNYFYFKILENWAEGNEIVIREGKDNAYLRETEEFFAKTEKSDIWSKKARETWKNINKKLFGYNTYISFEERRKFIDRLSIGDENEVYNDFLENIIPKTRVLFEIIKKYIKNGTSYTKIIEYLEPFMIYSDDITYKQYETINDFIYKNIEEHKSILRKNNKHFLKFIRENKSYFISTILPKLIKTNYQEIFDKKNYNINDSIDTQDSLKKIMNFDSGYLYNVVLSLSLLSYNQPIDIEEKISDELERLDGKVDEEKETEEAKQCEKEKKLVKRYITIDEMTEDNNAPVFVDKKYDNTPYDIGEEWKRNNSILIASADDSKLVIEELKKFLVENNGISEDKAQIDASAMIMGSREVQEGEYAYLDLQGDGNIKYYVRQNNVWRYDKSLSGLAPEQINFCNIKQNCFKIKETCTNLDSTKDLLKINILEDIEKRFEDELIKSQQQLKGDLQVELQYRSNNLQSLKRLKIFKMIKRDLLQLKIASTLEEREVLVSPYEDLKNIILSDTDLIKKYANLNKFIDQFCRTSNKDEEEFWFYCIDSGAKLLPTFYKELIDGFYTDNYLLTMEKIKKERGEKSDEGDKWVDKYSGHYLSNDIALDYSEGYDESGYKIKSREVMEEEKADKLRKARFQTEQKTYTSIVAKRTENLLKTLDEKLYISMKSDYNFIIKIVMESMNVNVPDEESYRELYNKKIKLGKKLITFEKKHDQVFIYSIISAYIIAVQGSIPGVISKRVFGDCKKSFSGFPLDGNADMTFLEYISCIMFAIRRKDRPLNIIPIALSGQEKKRRKKNYDDIQDKFVNKIKDFMTSKILTMKEVDDKLNLKREWKKTNKTTSLIISEFDVQRWTTFLPPLVPVTVTRLNNISTTFEKTLRTRIQEGSYEQYAHLWALYGKIASYSFSIIESVQRAINKEPLLLETKAGIPFLENACCNNGNPNTFIYFTEKETSIKRHSDIIMELGKLYEKYKYLHKGVFFNIMKNTKIIYPPVSIDFSKETIYLAFIKYCNFNTGVELDNDLKRVCLKNECKFRNIDSIENKILAMEAEGLNYSNETLNILLNIINRRNILYYDLDPPITTEKLHLEKTVAYLENKDSIICHPELLSHMKNIVDRFDVSIQGEDDIITSNFTSYIDRINREMSTKISRKMLEHGELGRKVKDLFIKYSPQGEVSHAKIKQKQSHFILNWDLIGDNVYMSQEDETGFTIFRMIKEMVTNICQVFPNIILHEVNFSERYVPKHWLSGSKKLSDKHKQDIISFMLKDGQGFSKFYKNKNIKPVLEYVLSQNEDIIALMDAIPFYSGITGKNKTGSIFDGEILKKLAYYFLLCSFSLYISAFSVDLRIDTNEDEDFMEEAEDGDDLDIIRGEQEVLEKDTLSLLNLYILKLGDYKKLLNVSAETINKNVLKTKTKEKEQIVKRLGDLTIEEREIEDIMKNSSLGDWSLGRTKAIFEYDNKQYDKEREKLEHDALLELKSGGLDDVSEFTGEVFNISNVIDQMEEDFIQNRIDDEVYDLSAIPEEDDDDRDNIDYM